jgi:nicotinate phosphoribosyltransferase
LRQLVRDGEITGAEPLQAARDRHQRALRELPDHARRLADGGPAIPTIFNGLGPQDGPAGQ